MEFNEEQQKAAQLIADIGSGKVDPATAPDANSAYRTVLAALQDIWSGHMSKGEDTIGLNWFGLEYWSPFPEILIITCCLVGFMYWVATRGDESTFDVMKPSGPSKVPKIENKKDK